jgi:hypothetical protein
MNKLTIIDKVFVLVSVDIELPINNSNYFVNRYSKVEPIGIDYFEKDEYNFDEKVTHWLKEETNKYVLSREELEKVISDAFDAGVNREYQERNYERRDYNAPIKEQYINSIQ